MPKKEEIDLLHIPINIEFLSEHSIKIEKKET